METALQFEILPQPDETTCGPTCLHAVYRYFGDELPLARVIEEAPELEQGGTLAVLLGCHALKRRYKATIYTLNLRVFDPTWFRPGAPPLRERLMAQMEVKESARLQTASQAYIEFLDLGGVVRMEDLSGSLIRRFLKRSIPILTGLSATYLYSCSREDNVTGKADDVGGYPSGHFVVLCGYDKQQRAVLVADPYASNPMGGKHYYAIGTDRVIRAILLGVLTYDANLLVIEPKRRSPNRSRKRGQADRLAPVNAKSQITNPKDGAVDK